jgi:hypothetical protein
VRRRFCGEVVGDARVEGGVFGVVGKDDKTELLVTWLTNVLLSLNLSGPVCGIGSGPLEAPASEPLPPPQPPADGTVADGTVAVPVGRACIFRVWA